MNERVIRELRLILEMLCGRELNSSGREYIQNRIKIYENRIKDEDRIFKDSIITEGFLRNR